MSNELRFDGKVAIITGGGNGLGRSHALLFASRGARVVVNDLGGSAHGAGKSSAAADKVVEEIKAAGGEAVANYDSVEDGAKIIQTALDCFGRIDIVVNNAGILRDTSFHKMTQEDWDLIYRVHVLGSFRVTHAAWPHLRDQGYGRVIMTASAAGIYGNFGQANYSMAKLGLLGLSNTLAHEGRKRNVLVNTIAPIAGSRLTETILPKELIEVLKPEYVSPLVVYLCHESSTETGGLYELGGGFFAKLRWERAAGQTFRIGRTITPELVAESWKKITGFDQATHPSDATQSMQPVMANIQAGPTKGGNQFIDVDQALGYEFPKMTSSYDERDLSIYALGVGAANDPLDDKELRFVYDMHSQGFLALPTFAVVPPLSALMANAKEGRFAPGLRYGLDRLLHGEQYTELLRPLPAKATLTHRIRVKDIFDKGKHAAVVMEVKSFDESGQELFRNEFTSIIRGAGGWGGDRGPSGEANAAPDRAPDAVVTDKTADNQALLYRLTGDWNPLHADPGFASAFGFPKPILHGLCTFGYAGRQVIKTFAGGDPRKLKSIKVRFAESVFPGETLVTEMWNESNTRILFRCKVKERDKVVISNAAIELHDVVPAAKPAAAPAPPAEKPAPAAAPAEKPAAPTTPAAPGSGDVFIAIRDHIERNPDLAAKIATIFLFKLTDPPSAWTIDLKSGNGSVIEGASGTPDVTLELADSDFIGMASGQVDPQKLYFGGKLKLSGNVMAAQKLSFLKHIDPEAAKAAVMKARSGGKPETPQAAPAAEPPKEDVASKIVGVLKERFAQDPGLGAGVDAIVQFILSSPDSAWYVDLKGSTPAVELGKASQPTTTLSLAEGDFVALVRGTESAQRLFQTGRLRVDGELRVASGRLGFLKGLI